MNNNSIYTTKTASLKAVKADIHSAGISKADIGTVNAKTVMVENEGVSTDILDLIQEA